MQSHHYEHAHTLLDTDVLESAICIGENGYLILRLEDNLDLQSIKPDLDFLETSSGRSLRITSAQSNSSMIDYSLRYFAPKYGVKEDPATGSANMIAAHFWRERFNQTNFCCYQAPARGGIIYSKFKNDELWVGGKVTMLADLYNR